jgi:hypothetical protein
MTVSEIRKCLQELRQRWTEYSTGKAQHFYGHHLLLGQFQSEKFAFDYVVGHHKRRLNKGKQKSVTSKKPKKKILKPAVVPEEVDASEEEEEEEDK